MAETKAHELLRKHQISLEELKTGRHTLHHLRGMVRNENLPFEVFQALVHLRR